MQFISLSLSLLALALAGRAVSREHESDGPSITFSGSPAGSPAPVAFAEGSPIFTSPPNAAFTGIAGGSSFPSGSGSGSGQGHRDDGNHPFNQLDGPHDPNFQGGDPNFHSGDGFHSQTDGHDFQPHSRDGKDGWLWSSTYYSGTWTSLLVAPTGAAAVTTATSPTAGPKSGSARTSGFTSIVASTGVLGAASTSSPGAFTGTASNLSTGLSLTLASLLLVTIGFVSM